ncbi:hypothetical protein [Streptococcus gallolyticus]|uniref:hypothetical protein n=1 Tax=Streptococcus gallolyticus TaxID=315405 RepID=UPI002284C2D1|nr:hypothetical protein [Streptococcus gallolyticus]MCY7191872.1 hypothetical protein [Streptococcus gallolyticus subsp. gallolyticus]MDO4963899.1 hypothetical protein [Streptococcus gallolyticus]
MSKTVRRFPLVADGEPVSNPPKAMALYENEDLITNIHGTYHEKDYDDVTRDYNFVGKTENDAERIKTVSEGKSYAELARDEARRDIKKKRQAYLSNDVKKMPSKATFQQQLKATLPKAPAKPTNKLSHLTEKMHQEDYILAEIPVTYKEPDNSSVPKPKKNNYDFLKRSQIYNKEAQQNQREHKVAQELNLTRFDDAN